MVAENKFIESKLSPKGKLFIFENLSSTQKWAHQNIDSLDYGDIIWAKEQTNGIGRSENKWYSPGKQCLTFSMFIKSFKNCLLNPLITQFIAVCVAETLKYYSVNSFYKWPNDLMVNENKISGIIADHYNKKSLIIAGIGINVNLNSNDIQYLNLARPATSMKIIKKKHFDIESILYIFIRNFYSNFNFFKNEGVNYIIRKWHSNDYLTNKFIQIKSGDSIFSGKYIGLDKKGRVGILTKNGNKFFFWSGEIEKIH